MKPSTLLVITAAVLACVAAPGTPGAADSEASAEAVQPANGVVAYYFHGNVRCATCRKIEAYTDEAIHSGFADALDNGTLVWSVVNIDKQPNKHFVEDFELTTRSVVLAEVRDGRVVRSKSLDKVWQLVRSEDDFASYIRAETAAFLEQR